MTVSTEACYAERAWTGVETSFAPGFPAMSPADLRLEHIVGTVRLPLVLGVHFNATLAAGTRMVTVTPLPAMPAAPAVIGFSRRTPATQAQQFRDDSRFSEELHEVQADREAMRAAETRRDADLATAKNAEQDQHLVAVDSAIAGVNTSLVLQDKRIDVLSGIMAGVPFPIDGLEFRPEQFLVVLPGFRVQTAADAAWAVGGALRLRSGVTYEYAGLLEFKPGLVVRSAGATLRHDGSATGSEFPLTIRSGVRYDEIDLSTPGTETSLDLIRLETSEGGILRIRSDVQRIGGGIIADGDIRVNVLISRKIDRPIYLYNPSTVPVDGGYIGFLDVKDYVRAFRADNCGFYVGGHHIEGKSPNASMSPGHNGFLIVGCRGWFIGKGYGADSGEHFHRIGGSAPGTATSDYTIDDQLIARSGGCALKINPTLLVSPGVTEKARRGKIGRIAAIDVANGDLQGNRELARFSHVDDLEVASLTAWTQSFAKSAQFAVQANDCRKVAIGEAGGSAINSGAVYFWSGSDVDGVNQFGGAIDDFKIGRLWGNNAGNNAITVDMGAFDVSNVEIVCDRLDGHAVNLMRWLSGNLTGRFMVTGPVAGLTTTQGLPNNDNMIIDIEQAGRRRVGRAANARLLAGFTASSSGLDLGATPASNMFGSFFASALGATAGDLAAGGSLALGRPGSDRRGAVIYALQSGVSAASVGLAIGVTGTGSSASDALALAAFFRPDGDLELTQAGKGYRAKSPNSENWRLSPPDLAGAVGTTQAALWTKVA